MRTPVELRFEKGDPVRDYWLAKGEGFSVENRRGRVVGQVVDVVVDPQEQRVMSLVIQKAHGLSELSADEVQAVVPSRDTFVLDGARGRERKERPRRVGAGERLARFRSWAAPRLRRAGALLAAAAREVAAWVAGVARVLAAELRQRAR